MSAAKVIDLNKNDKNFLKNPTEIAEVHAKIDGEIRELKENLFYLLIKWKKDLILDQKVNALQWMRRQYLHFLR